MDNETGSEQSLSSILTQAYDKIQDTPEPEQAEPVKEDSSPQVAETVKPAEEAVAKEPEKVAEPAKVDAPDTWTQAAKAKFATLDPDIQKEILKREEDVKNGFTKYSEDRKYAQTLRDVINPYMPIITAEGGNPATAVQTLLNTAYQLRTGSPQQKVQMLQQIARDYNVDISMLSQDSEESYVDPIVAETRNELNQIKSEITTQKQTALNAQVNAFASDPANKHFEKLRPVMGQMLGAGQASDLKDAYEKAKWLVPEVRDLILAEQEQEKETKRMEEQKAAAAAAKKAAGVQLSSKADVKGASKPASLRESLEKKFEQIQAA